jgi:predicted PhzF superfamily epimerase YddE/YHI9
VAQWLVGTGRVTPPYLATQGTRLGRSGRIRVTEDAGEIWIGGRVSIAVEGTIDTPS